VSKEHVPIACHVVWGTKQFRFASNAGGSVPRWGQSVSTPGAVNRALDPLDLEPIVPLDRHPHDSEREILEQIGGIEARFGLPGGNFGILPLFFGQMSIKKLRTKGNSLMAKAKDTNQTSVAPTTATDSATEMTTTTTNENCDIVSQFSQEIWIEGDKIKKLTDDDIVKRYSAAVTIGRMARDIRIVFFDEMCRRFKNYTKKREGVPTLECAFSDYGLNYDSERQAVYREKKRLLEDLQPQPQEKEEKVLPQFADGAEVVVKATGHPFKVEHDNVTADKVVGEETMEDDGLEVRAEYKREELIAKDESEAATKPKPERPACKNCAKLRAKVAKLEEQLADAKDLIEALEASTACHGMEAA
jgi:hypothetical protein